MSRGSEPITDSDEGLVTSDKPQAISTMLAITGPKYAESTAKVPAQI